MTEFDYPTDSHAATDEPVTPPPPAAKPRAGGAQWGTVICSAVAALVVSALIVAIGVVGVVIAAPDEETPTTVVNLGSGQGAATVAQPAGDTTTDSVPTGSPDTDGGPTGTTPTPGVPGAPADTDSPGQTPSTAVTRAPSSNGTLPANFRVTSAQPTVSDLDSIVRFLVATPASDEAKAANIEGGMTAVVVPRTVYTLGLFRAPLGWSQVSGPLERSGDSVTAALASGSAGRPTIRLRIEFRRIDGNWRLAASSLCQGVKTVGLNVYCNS